MAFFIVWKITAVYKSGIPLEQDIPEIKQDGFDVVGHPAILLSAYPRNFSSSRRSGDIVSLPCQSLSFHPLDRKSGSFSTEAGYSTPKHSTLSASLLSPARWAGSHRQCSCSPNIHIHRT
jgi:hypothetical protein